MEQFLFVVVLIAVIILLAVMGLSEFKNNRHSTKVCKHCGQTIPWNASTCPYCHHDPGIDVVSEMKHARHSPSFYLVVVFVAVMFLAIAVAACAGG